MVNIRSQLQECIVCQTEYFGDLVFLIEKYIKWQFTFDTP